MQSDIARCLLRKLWLIVLLGLSPAADAFCQTEISEAEQYRKILQAGGRKDYAEVLTEGAKLIKRTDRYEQVYAKIARAAKASGQTKQAETLFESLLQLPVPNPRAYYGLGLLRAEEGNYLAAIEYYQKCFAANTEFPLAPMALVDAYLVDKRLQDAGSYLLSIVQLHPRSSAARLALGYYFTKLQKADAAIVEFDAASALSPKSFEVYYRKAQILRQIGRNKESLDVLDKCRLLLQEQDNEDHRQAFLNLYAINHLNLGNYSEATDLFSQALRMAKELGDKGYEEASLAYLGSLHEMQDKYSQALSVYQRALEVAKDSDSPFSRVNLRRFPGRIGRIYYLLGDLSAAMEFFQTGLREARKAEDQVIESLLLSYIGDVFLAQLNISEAVGSYRQAVEISRQLPNPFYQNSAQDALSDVYLHTGEYQKADAVIQQGIVLSRKLNNFEKEAIFLNKAGRLLWLLNKPGLSIDLYKQALQLALGKNKVFQAWAASAGLAAAYAKLGQLQTAQEYYRQAIELIEQVRSGLAVEEEKSFFFDDKVKTYKDLIAILIELHGKDAVKGYDREAFEFSERARGRAFLDLLAESKVNVEQGLAPDLREQRRQIDAAIARINSELMKERLPEPAKQNRTAIEELEKQRGQADRDYSNWLREVRRRNPQYAALKYPEPISLAHTQQLLDDGTLMLSYSLGETSSFLFAVSRDGFWVKSLNGSAKEIGRETAQLMAAIKNRSTIEFRRSSVRLYERLIQPAADLLKGKRELVVVADGALHRLPFEVLLPPSSRQITQSDPRKLPYLVRDYAISYAPSASVLAGLQDYRREAVPEQKAFLAFADPIYDAEAQGKDSTVAMVTRSARGDDGQWKFDSLLHSKNEAETIAKLFPAGQADVFQGAQATEENAKAAGRLAKYRILHFAAHGLINQHRPRFSGIVLTLPRNSQQAANAVEDGILQAYEIFNLKLNADLVVLSACETGLGKEVNGEGMMSLIRAFIYAGTPSVVASLWNVDDEKSADLMIRFYTHLQSGKSKSEALRQAQLEMIQKSGAPYFWAPFVLVGRAK